MIAKASSKDNFMYLLLALISLLFGIALVDQVFVGEGQHFMMAITVVTLMLGVWSIRYEKHWFRSGLGLTAAVAIVTALSWGLDFADLDLIHRFLILAFFILTALQASKQVLFSGAIDFNKVVGSICIFLLLGLIWAMFYLLVFDLLPGAFNGLNASSSWSDLIYYSFVTLTTLGYGEITPAVPVAGELTSHPP